MMFTANSVSDVDHSSCSSENNIEHDHISRDGLEYENIVNENEIGEDVDSGNDTDSVIVGKIYKPTVADEFTPKVDMVFKNIDIGVDFYRKYGQMSGFDIRMYTVKRFQDDKSIRERRVVCHRNGKLANKSIDTSVEGSRDKRNTTAKVTGCKAVIVFNRVGRTEEFSVKVFKEYHNHEFEEIRNLRVSRNLSYSDEEFVIRCLTVKIGPTKSHKIKTVFEGGYENFDPKVIDFKNLRRDILSLLDGKDAQCLVNKLNIRKRDYPNFSFVYKEKDRMLDALFWADETDKAYYQEFGDVISFDATFRTNKYLMVFVPFTAIDHHNRSVTVGAGLLCNESVESYRWLLNNFIKIHGKQPKLVLTDQDASILQAVEKEFPETKHRFCMWHIMKKLPKKVFGDILKNTDFRKRLNKLVWDIYLDVDGFEVGWKLLISDFNFEQKRWFNNLFNVRSSWIPAFFKELPMSGLMKTTSRSESTNSFFNTFSLEGNLLVNLLTNYDSALHKQRNSQREFDLSTKTAKYFFKTELQIERHAADLYTTSVFKDVQKDIVRGLYSCFESNSEIVDGWEVYSVIHKSKIKKVKAEYKVKIKMDEMLIDCTCDQFGRNGILCRHAFKILIKKEFEQIPEKYIASRWRKDVISSKYFLTNHGCEESNGVFGKQLRQVYSNIEKCVQISRHNEEKMDALVKSSEVLLKEYSDGCTTKINHSRKRNVEQLMGISIPDDADVQIKNPGVQKNKGSWNKKRIPSVGEIRKPAKMASRTCTGCGEKAGHNLRTCPKKPADKE